MVRLGPVWSEEMDDLDAPHGQRIRDETPVAAPRDGFGAHEGHRALSRPRDHHVEGLLECAGLHVVRVPAESFDTPRLMG
jgi:hypothetical protein